MSSVVNLDFALNEDKKIIYIKDAPKKQVYGCPSCGGEVIPVKGEIMAWHFRHKAESSCTNESVLHATAKGLLVDLLNRGGEISVPGYKKYLCGCKDKNTHFLCISGNAQPEVYFEGFRLDIAVFKNGKIFCGIEIVVSHPMTDEKKERCSVPLIEVSGKEVLSCFLM